jgi:2-dehydro-3-deoxygluconokinase
MSWTQGRGPEIVTFGEIMLRLSPPNHLRFTQARSFEAVYGGGEANVCVSLANFGLQTEFVTRLPANELGEACLQYLRQYNVGTRHVLRGGERLGVYFLESGSNMRASQVIYDRANSAFASLKSGMLDWPAVFSAAGWFHWTGITPAISEGAACLCLEAAQAARRMGLTVSCDMNYRAKLWKWGRPAAEVMGELLTFCDVVIANEEDADKVFAIRPPGGDVQAGKVDAAGYRSVCAELARRFPNLKTIAITLRGSLSADHNTWSAMLWSQGELYQAPLYDLTPIVDRVGGGDSFTAGLIYGMLQFPKDPQRALDFAVAASALKHTIYGDFNLVSAAEVDKLMQGDHSGRVSR